MAIRWRASSRPCRHAGYRGHNAPSDYKFRIFTASQKRRVTPQIRREFRRRAAIEPVIGHLKPSTAIDTKLITGPDPYAASYLMLRKRGEGARLRHFFRNHLVAYLWAREYVSLVSRSGQLS